MTHGIQDSSFYESFSHFNLTNATVESLKILLINKNIYARKVSSLLKMETNKVLLVRNNYVTLTKVK